MRIAIILLFLSLFLGSCCPRTISSSEHRDSIRIEYRYQDRIEKDTVYSRDSIYVREKGDTIYIYKDRYKYVDRFVRDTIYVADTLYKDVFIKEVKQVRYVPKFYKYCMWIAFIFAGYVLIKLYRKFGFS